MSIIAVWLIINSHISNTQMIPNSFDLFAETFVRYNWFSGTLQLLHLSLSYSKQVTLSQEFNRTFILWFIHCYIRHTFWYWDREWSGPKVMYATLKVFWWEHVTSVLQWDTANTSKESSIIIYLVKKTKRIAICLPRAHNIIFKTYIQKNVLNNIEDCCISIINYV